jgi:D-3-phosphoglycerate dehydrogenase
MNEVKNILISTSSFGKYDHEPLKKIEEKGFQTILNPHKRKLTESEIQELIEKYQPVGLIAGVEPLTKQVLETAKNLIVISRCGTGMDAVDLEAAKDLNIVVTNTPDGPTISVAELTLGLILTLLRKIHIADSSIRRGGWERPMGSLLYDKVLGIIGCGRIGTYLAKLVSNFGCNVLGCDPLCHVCEWYELHDLGSILERADIVSLHIPYSKENQNFFDKERLGALKKGAILINTSRGGLVDEKALYDALKSGNLEGAALDCFEQEPYSGPLKSLDNVVLTGHIGSYAIEGRMMMEKQAVENLFHKLDKLEKMN